MKGFTFIYQVYREVTVTENQVETILFDKYKKGSVVKYVVSNTIVEEIDSTEILSGNE
jgi:hypothetical protein